MELLVTVWDVVSFVLEDLVTNISISNIIAPDATSFVGLLNEVLYQIYLIAITGMLIGQKITPRNTKKHVPYHFLEDFVVVSVINTNYVTYIPWTDSPLIVSISFDGY